MKKYLSIILVFLFLGLLYSGEEESLLPVIKEGKYNIEFRKGKTFFVDFNYEVDVQGKAKFYEAWIEVVLYNKEGKEMESFGQQIKIKPKELQTFYGKRMIIIKVAKEIEEVGFNLGIYQKKY